jgi:hypothetical protein
VVVGFEGEGAVLAVILAFITKREKKKRAHGEPSLNW